MKDSPYSIEVFYVDHGVKPTTYQGVVNHHCGLSYGEPPELWTVKFADGRIHQIRYDLVLRIEMVEPKSVSPEILKALANK